ncbi:hypothetical protein AURDEDRAFT_185654 [Auricularia subglabra TFB-10046 SS5]|nr:hypothetical protein AURDEDRAFT_185654 [Auricularia subglabra TFB-10046 SS5]
MAGPSLVLTFGMILMGAFLAVFLTGIATLQIWNYFRNFGATDSKGLRLMVLFVYLVDTLHSALIVSAMYQYLILSFGDYTMLGSVVVCLRLTIIINGASAFLVQTYYCNRVRRITQSNLLAGGCWALAIVRLAFSVLIAITMWEFPQCDTLVLPRFRWMVSTTLIVGAASDIGIAACICHRLLRLRGVGVRETDRLVDRLVNLTVGSGLMTSVAAGIECILYLSMHNFTFMIPYCAVSKLFTNSLLASLNERDYTRREMMVDIDKKLSTTTSSDRMVLSNDPSARLVAVVGATGYQSGSVIDNLIESDKFYCLLCLARDARQLVALKLKVRGVKDFEVNIIVGNESATVTNFWEHQSSEGGITEGKLMVDAAKEAAAQLLVWQGLEDYTKRKNGAKTNVAHFDGKSAVTAYAFTQLPTVDVQAGFIADTLQSTLIAVAMYQYLILSFGDDAMLVNAVFPLRLTIVLNGGLAFVVQGYLLAGGCWLLAVLRLAFSAAIAVTLWQYPRSDTLVLPRFRWTVSTTLIVGAVSDIAIAACLCHRLLRLRGVGVRETDRLVDRLVNLTIGSGLMTSVAAGIEVILYLSMHNFIFTIPYCAVSKLFTNSLLASLNERDYTRREMMIDVDKKLATTPSSVRCVV